MMSFLFFICFTLTALLYRIFPSSVTVWLNLTIITVVSWCLFHIKLTPNRPKYDELRSAKAFNAYDMTGIVLVVFALYGLVFWGEVIYVPIPPEDFLWDVYTITVTINYVIPAAIYLYWRIRFYRDVRRKAEMYGWSLSANIFEFLFTGRRNVHNITVETSSGTQTIGILGGVGAMQYVIENGTIKSQRVMPLDKKYAFLDYGDVEKEKLHRWYRVKKRTRPLPESLGNVYLMIQPNVFVVSNEFLVDVGEEVEGMRLLDMETGMKIFGV